MFKWPTIRLFAVTGPKPTCPTARAHCLHFELPDSASFGVALGLSRQAVLELDVEWMGWSVIRELAFSFLDQPFLDREIRLDFDDSMSYR